jgi:hypothetical protein
MPLRALTTLLPFGITTWLVREMHLWRWRRERSRSGAPVTIARRRGGRGYMLASRRSDAAGL